MSLPIASKVSDAELLREWIDKVRGRVGAKVIRIPWRVVRELVTTQRLESWWRNDLTPDQGAERVVAFWRKHRS